MPSYPRYISYLNVYIVDNRIHIKKENNTLNCIKTVDYDSDHNKLGIGINMREKENPFTFFLEDPILKYDYEFKNII